MHTAKGGSYRLIPTVTNFKGVVLGTGGCKGTLLSAKAVSSYLDTDIISSLKAKNGSSAIEKVSSNSLLYVKSLLDAHNDDQPMM
ncbi:hypothetical protein MUCCIDRAFT_156249 [Mucor lusitanicus CBS 277.49]|uniref:Uncharacterized protein n=1 Tax=Mucor lusitanicus CBS 277.49 TaxID=747725 RepID=A0A162RAQ2_MUCCL|nr:hypothetical protein MUCCIDRAFT_156249 [Mucor lusitanicus CBS 277.49]